MEDQEQEPQASPELTFTKVEDFVTAYANNVQFEQNAWDIKMIFGELDQTGGKTNVVEQHTSITLSWAEAKVLSFFLRVQIAAHEIEDGKIQIPKRVLPQEPGALAAEYKTNPGAIAVREAVIKLREQFLAEL